jgi:hypothetical protein
VTCDTFNFTVDDCNGGSCIFLPPTLDPLFSFLAILTGLEIPIGYEPQQLSIAVITRFVQAATPTISQTTFPFPVTYLNDPTCQFNFPGVINIYGESVTSVAPLQEADLPCTFQNFFVSSSEFTNSIRAIQTLPFGDVITVFNLYNQALAWVVSNSFVACVNMTERYLLLSSPQQNTFTNVQACFATNGSAPSYLTDPCCNPVEQQVTCCVPRTTTAISPLFTINEGNVNSTCNLAQCTLNTLKDYIVLAQSTQSRELSCSAALTLALEDPLLDYNQNPLDYCYFHTYFIQCNVTADCSFLGPGSICLGLGYCTIPCVTNSDCLTEQCVLQQSTPTCLLYDPFGIHTNNTEADLFFISCVEQQLEPFVALFIRQEMGLDASANQTEYISAFFDNMFVDQCVGPFIPADQFNRTACEEVMQCNWAFCDSYDSPNECTAEYCLDPMISTSTFCGYCIDDVCQEVSNYPACRYSGPFTQEICEQLFNGSYNPLPTYNPPNCFRPTNGSIDLCFPPERCGDVALSNNACNPYCFVVDITNETECNATGAINTFPLSWLDWTRNGTVFGVCVMSNITDLNTCYQMGNNRTEWWPGTTWTDAYLMSPSQCTGYCSGGYWPLEISDEATCLNQYYCDGCSTCYDEASCIASGQCNDETGCYLPFQPDGVTCANDGYQVWTPIGCFRSDLNQSQCALLGGNWTSKSIDAVTCTTKASICVDPTTVLLPSAMNLPPPGYSNKNATECAECGGYIASFYQWTSSNWTRRTFYPFEWKVRNYTQANAWGRALNFSLVVDFWNSAVARRFAGIVSSELLCRYGQITSSLSDIACACGEDKDQISRLCYITITQSVIAVAEPCQGINALFNFSLGYLVSEPEFLAQGTDCVDIQIAVVPQSQFQQNQIITLSSVSVSMPQTNEIDQVRFIKNANKVVVGELIGDGVSFELSNNVTTGLTACLYFPKNINSTLNITWLDFALPEANFTSFRPANLNISLFTTEACIDLKNSLTIFPIGLIDNWSTATFIETFDPGQLALIFLGMVLYFLMLGFTAYHFVLHLVDLRKEKFWNIARIALLTLGVLLLIRIIYLIMLPNGVIAVAPAVDVVFSELPALLFFFIYSLIVIRWAEIYHFTMTAGQKTGITKLRPVAIVFNVSLIVAYIVLVVVFFSVSSNVPFNCATPLITLQQLPPPEIVAILYKVFFGLVCLGMSIAFAVYGLRIILFLRSSSTLVAANQKNNQRKKAIIKLIIVSSVGAGCLLVQAINLLDSSFDKSGVRTLVGVLILLYIVELTPAFIFIWMFKKTSLFVRLRKRLFGTSTSMNMRDLTSTAGTELIEVSGRRPAASSLSTINEKQNHAKTSVSIAQLKEITSEVSALNVGESELNANKNCEDNQEQNEPYIPIGQG